MNTPSAAGPTGLAGTRWSNSPRKPPGPGTSTRNLPGHTLAEIARRSYGDGAIVNQDLEEGWKRGIAHAMADRIIRPLEIPATEKC